MVKRSKIGTFKVFLYLFYKCVFSFTGPEFPKIDRFPVSSLPDDVLSIVFNKYFSTRDKMAIGLVCGRFRNLLKWGNEHLDLRLVVGSCQVENVHYINGSQVAIDKWFTLIVILLEKATITALSCDNLDFSTFGLRFLFEDRFKLVSIKLNGSCSKLYNWFLQNDRLLSNVNSMCFTHFSFNLTRLTEKLNNKPIRNLTVFAKYQRRMKTRSIESKDVATLINSLDQLEHLHISGLKWIGINEFLENVNVTKNLKSLKLECKKEHYANVNQLINLFPIIWNKFPALESYSLLKCPGLTNSVSQYMCRLSG